MAGRFVGRQRELRAMQQGCEGRRSGVAITGPAGVGKSRLLSELEHSLGNADWRVVTIIGTVAGRTMPMGALASLLPHDPPANEALLLAQVLRNLVGDGASRVLVGVDDAHLLDDATVALLTELVHRRTATVALSIRTLDETSIALAELVSSDGIERIDLRPMPADDIATLASVLLPGRVDAHTVAELTDRVRGNPLLLRELVADATSSGVLVRTGDAWTLQGDLGAGPRLTELIELRTRRLSSDLNDVLDRVAVAEPIDLGLVDPTGAGVTGELERLDLARVEQVDGRWMVRTDHPLVGEAIRHSMTPGHRLAVLRALSHDIAALASLGPGLAARAASWFHEAGEELPATVAADAAWEALVALDLDNAAALAAPAAPHHWRAAFVLAEIARLGGRGDDAVGWLTNAAELAASDQDIRRVAMAHSAVRSFQLSDPKAGIAVLCEAADRMSDEVHGLELRCEAAFMATMLGEFDETVLTCREVLARPGIDPLTTWTAAINFGYAQVLLGDVTELRAVLGRARAAFPTIRHDHPEATDLLAALSIGLEILDGDLGEATRLAVTQLDHLRRAGSHRGMTAALSTDTLLFGGDPRALDVAYESIQQLRVYDPFNSLPYGLGYAALITSLHGDVARAQALLDEIDRDSIDVRSQAVVGRATAAIAAQQDLGEAAEIAFASGMRAIETSHVSLGAFGVFDALAYGQRARIAPVLAEVCAESTSLLLRIMGDHGHAIATGDLAGAAATAGVLHDAGATFLAASAFANTAAMIDDPVDARRMAARSTMALLGTDWLAVPWEIDDLDGALSRREVEVAAAAAEGKSNKDIAEELYVSARTVGNHLHRAYAKLEVGGRGELAKVLALSS